MLLFLAILSNFSQNIMNCGIQELLAKSAILRNIVTYFLIYFTINFTEESPVHPYELFDKALIVYILFVLLMKQNKYFFIANVVLIFIIYVNSQTSEYYQKVKDKDKENIIDTVNNIFIAILPITLIVGFVIYYFKQLSDYGVKFDMFKFIFGTSKCSSLD